MEMLEGIKFEEPNKDNVDLGDFLVSDTFPSGAVLASIHHIKEDRVSAKTLERGIYGAFYQRAVILKKDGSCLVGKKAYEQLVESKTPTLN